ncbi:MAG: DegQ family serine endoprotease [Alphaproteobacteria bacterium]
MRLQPSKKVRNIILFSSLLAFSAAMPVLWHTPIANAEINGPASDFADLAEKLSPAVVNISTTQVIKGAVGGGKQPQEIPQLPPGSPFEPFFKDFFDQEGQALTPRKAVSLGSGFIIDAAKGLVVTNNHVIANADEVTVILHDDTSLKAKILGKDEKTDLAVLKVETAGKKLVDVKWGNSDAMKVGNWVMAIGNPFGLGGTVTAGIVSARARNINAGPYDDFIQTDASINRGNSGGPMFNTKGEVIGINTAIFSPSGGSVGIGFAIPSNLAEPVVRQLIDFGRTKRGWIGVRIQSVDEVIADSIGLKQAEGALVTGMIPGSPAEKAGLQRNDVIVEFNGVPIKEMRRLPRLVAGVPVGKSADLKIWRNKEFITRKIEVAELEAAEDAGLIDKNPTASEEKPDTGAGTMLAEVGLTVNNLTAATRERYQIDSAVKGVLITAVVAGSNAAERGVTAGDVIVEVNQTEVHTPQDVRKIVDQAKKEKKPLLVLLERQGDQRILGLKLEAEKK